MEGYNSLPSTSLSLFTLGLIHVNHIFNWYLLSKPAESFLITAAALTLGFKIWISKHPERCLSALEINDESSNAKEHEIGRSSVQVLSSTDNSNFERTETTELPRDGHLTMEDAPLDKLSSELKPSEQSNAPEETVITHTSPKKRNMPIRWMASGDSERDIFTVIKHAIMIYNQEDDQWVMDHLAGPPLTECPATKNMSCKSTREILYEVLPSIHLHEIEELTLRNVEHSQRVICPCHGNELQVAINTKDMQCMETVLRCGRINLNEPSGPGGLPISVAAELGLSDVVELLIAYGARINTSDAFARACSSGHYRVVDTLLRYPVHVHENPGCLLKACFDGHAEVVASLLTWRSRGGKYHRKSLPLTRCVQSAIRKRFGEEQQNVCKFLDSMPEMLYSTTYTKHAYMRACVIIEMLIEAGVAHKDECNCGGLNWMGSHRIRWWLQQRREKGKEAELADPPAVSVHEMNELDRSTVKRVVARHQYPIKPISLHDGFDVLFRGFVQLWDASYRDARGWYWESPEAYLESWPEHPTWDQMEEQREI